MGPGLNHDFRLYSLIDVLSKMKGGISIDGIHVGQLQGMQMECGLGEYPRITLDVVIDGRGVDNLIDWAKFSEVMQ